MISANHSRYFYHCLTKSRLLAIVIFALLSLYVSVAMAKTNESSEARFTALNNNTQIVVQASPESKRVVKLSISYPSGKEKYPLIVFSHGHALDNQSYHNLTNYWVERGYFVVAPMHLDSGGDLAAMSAIAEQYGRDWISASRIIEMRAVIDQIDNIVASLDDFNGEVLSDKVIAAGHSYGALSSQHLSGAKVELKGDSIYPIPATLVDKRVVAVVAISPPGLMKDNLTAATWLNYKTPQLVVTGPNDFFPFIWPNYEDHFVSYLTAQEGQNYLLVLDQMDHYLGNLIGRLERDSPPQILALKNLQEVSFMFIDNYLPRNTSINSNERQLKNYSIISKRDGILRYEHR